MWKYFSANNTYQYLDVLPKLIDKYNNTKHRSIKMTPTEASLKKNEGTVYYNLYGNLQYIKQTPKFKIGDKVRISKKKEKDLANEPIEGSFYEQELLKTDQEIFRIEKVLKRDYKNKRALVKWRGYDKQFNSYVPIKDIINI